MPSNSASGMAFLGDLDGDGLHAEVAVGDHRDDSTNTGSGAVYICWLDPGDGSISKQTKLANGQGGVQDNTLAARAYFGWSITLLGDLDGDGLAAEMAVGALDPLGPGSVWLIWLRPSDGHATKLVQLASGAGAMPGLANYGNFGHGVATLGHPSWILVGSRSDSSGGSGAGAAFAITINAAGTATAVTKYLTGQNGFPSISQSSNNIGSSVSCLGDMDGSGVGVHVAIGANGRPYNGDISAGAVFVMRIRSSNDQASGVVEIGDGRGGLPQGSVQSSSRFGSASAFLGELDDSGWPVLLVGAPYDDTGVADAGAAYMLWLDRSAGTVQQHVKLANGLSGMPSSVFGESANYGSRLVALGNPDGSEGVDAVVDRQSGLLLPLVSAELQLTASSITPSAGLSMAGGAEIVVDGIEPPLSSSLDAGWLNATLPFVVDGVAVDWLDIGDGSSITLRAPRATQATLAVNFSIAVGSQPLRLPVVLSYAAGPVGVVAASTWALGVPSAEAAAATSHAGAALARVGDADGDGCSRDVLIGTPGHDTPATASAGNASTRVGSGGLLLRGQSCSSPNASLANLSLLIDGKQLQSADVLPAGAELGSSVAWLGSASPRVGLRWTYIAAGTPGSHDGNGSVLLLRIDHDDGPGDDGWSVELLSKLSSAKVTSISLALAGSRLGASLALANAVGESTATLLIGAPAASDGRGGVLVADVAVSTGQLLPDPVWISDSPGGLPNETLSPGDAFGSAVAWAHIAGVGASGSLQLMVGAPGDDSAGTDSGCVYLLTLHVQNREVATWQRLSKELGRTKAGYRLGAALAWLGDVDGDGVFEEVLVGAPGDSAALIAWVRAENGTATSQRGRWLARGWPGMPSSVPESFGSALAAVGDWDDDGVASDVLIGAPLADSTNGSVVHIRFDVVGTSHPPWGDGLKVDLMSVSPHLALPLDQPTLIRINGTALYEWDPLAQKPQQAFPPEVLISGLDPRGCEVEEVSFDGRAFTCWLSPSLEPNRTLRVKAGQAVSATGLEVSYDIQGSVEAVDDQSPLLQSGGEARTFTGVGLLRAGAFSAGELQAAGVGQLLIGSEYSCPVTSMTYSSDGSWVRCDSMPAGVGGPHAVRLQLPGGIESNSSVTVSYEAAVVSSIFPSMVQLTSVNLLNFTISGSLFGHSLADTPRVVIGGNDCLDIKWHSSTELFCAAVAGNFTDHDVVVFTGTPSLPSTGGNARLDYLESPQVVAALPNEVGTRGGDNITCMGISFADQEHIIDQVLVGDAPCSHWAMVDSFSMTCTTPPGTGRSKYITIVTKFGMVLPSVVPVLSYKAPVLTSASPGVAFPEPGLQHDFALIGTGFGVDTNHSTVDWVTIAGKLCPSVDHVSDSMVRCVGIHPPWDGEQVVQVSVSGQVSEAKALIEFQDPPSVRSLDPPTASTAGDNITVYGTGFGGSVAEVEALWIGGQNCSNLHDHSSTAVSCEAPAGIGSNLNVSIVVAKNGASEPKPLFSYKPPSVEALAVLRSGGQVEDYTFAGLESVDLAVSVENAGTLVAGATLTLSSGDAWSQVCPLLVRAGSAANETDGIDQLRQLVCMGLSLATFPDTSGTLRAVLEVGGQSSTKSASSIDVVGRPAVSLVTPSTGISTHGAGNTSHAEVRILGTNLGQQPSDVLSVSVGGVECPLVEWKQPDGESPQLLVAIPPGVGAAVALKVTTRGGLSDASRTVGYQPAEVASIEPTYALTGTGTAAFNITGQHFGNKPSDLDGIQVGEQECSDIEWVSSTRVVCHAVSRSRWESRSVTVTVGGQEGLKNSYFEAVGDPVVEVVSPAIAGVGKDILLLGNAFGRQASDIARVTVLGEPCPKVQHRGSTALSCKLPAPPSWAAAQAMTDPSVLRAVPLVVLNSAGRESNAANVTYSGFGVRLAEVPTHLLAWRPVGEPRRFTVRWAFPSDSQMEDVDDVESFTIELAPLASNSPAQEVSVRVADLATTTVTTSEGVRVFRHSDFVFTEAPVYIRIRAVNSAGGGPWSEATPPVPATCTDGTFLQTQVDASRWDCGVCPVGAFCGGANAANVTALPGFWRVPWSRSGLGFSKCPREDSCVGYEVPLFLDSANSSANGSDASPASSRLLLARAQAASHEPAEALPTRWLEAAMASNNAAWKEKERRALQTGFWGGFEAGLSAAGQAVPNLAQPPAHVDRRLAVDNDEDSPLLNETLATDEVPTAVELRLWGDPAAMERCEEGYHGTMCTSCEPGYTRWGNFGCRKCKSAAVVALAMVGLAVLMFVIISYLIVSAIRSGAEKTPVGTAAIKVAFSHIQTVAIAASFNLEWPDSVLSLFAGMASASSVSSEVLSLDCAMPAADDAAAASAAGGGSRFFDKAAIVLTLPPLILGLAAIVWVVGATQGGGRHPVGAAARVPPHQLRPVPPPKPPVASRVGTRATTNPMRRRVAQMAAAGGEALAPSAHLPGATTTSSGRTLVGRMREQLSISSQAIGVNLSTWDKWMTSAVVILFLVHMSVTTTSLQLLTCRDVAPAEADTDSSVLDGDLVPAAAASLAEVTDGGCNAAETHRRLVQDLEVCCYDKGAQRSMYGLGIPGLLVYAFGIPFASALLLWWRQDSLHSHHTKTTLGFLYAGFKDEAYYWESVVMLRKVLVAVIAVVLEPMGVTLQTYTALALIAAVMVVHARMWPYARTVLNRLELVSLATAFVTFECGLFLTDPATSRPMRITATMVIFLFNVVFLAAAAFVILWDKLGIRAWRQKRLQTATSAPKRRPFSRRFSLMWSRSQPTKAPSALKR